MDQHPVFIESGKLASERPKEWLVSIDLATSYCFGVIEGLQRLHLFLQFVLLPWSLVS